MAVTFTSGANIITVQNPTVQNTIAVEKLGAGNRSAGGTRYWYSKGITIYTLRLHWDELRDTEKRDFLDFFDNVVQGPLTQFIYRDHRGYNWLAYFQDEKIEFSEMADESTGNTTFVSGGVTYPTTERHAGVWATDVILEVSAIPTTTTMSATTTSTSTSTNP